MNYLSKADEDRLFEAHAAICRTLANPWRLRIVEALGDGESSVGALAERLGISMSNLSQHLALMRDKGVVEARKSGGYVHYRLTSKKTLAAWRLMREVLMERMALAGALSAGLGSPQDTGGREAASKDSQGTVRK
jgi:ArsR family transcriptional regulator